MGRDTCIPALGWITGILTRKYATHGYPCGTLYHPDDATVGNAAEPSIRKLRVGRAVLKASCNLSCMFPSLGHDLSASRIVKSRRKASRVDCPLLEAPMSYGLVQCTVKQAPRTGRKPGCHNLVAHVSPSCTTR